MKNRTVLRLGMMALMMVTMSGGLVPAFAASADFVDVDSTNVFRGDIQWLVDAQITRGCNPPDGDRYCPDDPVTRGQMAAFLVRALGLEQANPDAFADDDASVFEGDIDKLASSGIARGCNPPTNDMFCPDDPITRGQMAAFLVRALELAPAPDGGFVDVDGSVFVDDIRRLAESGVTRGCNPPVNDRFCPDDLVTRGQMAAFIRRGLELGVDGRLTLVRAISTTAYPSFDPTALVFWEETARLVLLDSAAEEQPGFSGINAFVLDRLGNVIYDWSTLPFTSEPAGAAWDPLRDELYVADDDIRVVSVVDPGPDGILGSGDDAVVRSFDSGRFGARDPEGLAFDPATGDLFVIVGKDSFSPMIYRVSPGANDVIDGVAPDGDDTVVEIDVVPLGITDPEGATFDTQSRTLLVVDRDTPGVVFELSPDGALVEEFGVSTTGVDLAGIELGTSSDSAFRRSLYLVNRGDRGEPDGVVFEFRYD